VFVLLYDVVEMATYKAKGVETTRGIVDMTERVEDQFQREIKQ
jgi:hypothetical protein